MRLILILLAAAALVVGCGKGTPPTPSAAPESPAPSPAPAAPVAEVEPPVDEAALAAMATALVEIKDRHTCNRLMGCKPALALAQHGHAAVPLIVDVLQARGSQDGYWVPKLADLLGQLDDERALPLLHELMAEPRWEVRSRAALSVARLARPASVQPVEAALTKVSGGDDLPFEAALLYGMARLDRPVDGAPAREALARRLSPDYPALARLNPGFYAFIVQLIGEARVHEALPTVRLGITHMDRYVRIGSVQTAAALKDTGALPYLVGRLDDGLPSVRRAVLGALQEITGSRALTEPSEWAEWCERRDCRGALAGGLPEGTPTGGPAVGETPPVDGPARAPETAP